MIPPEVIQWMQAAAVLLAAVIAAPVVVAGYRNGGAVVAWAKDRLSHKGGGEKPSVTYQTAMMNLAVVRTRLVDTKKIDEEGVCESIEKITLALVAGSDQ